MSEFIGFVVIEIIFNFIGAVIRWWFGTIGRTIKNKPKHKFTEYLNGPKNPDHFDNQAHGTNNVIIGVVSTIVIILLVVLVERL
ncbi:hypothetical protein [Salegentibacter sp. T436]|uniref:hypothetical protein n=1 Tax=Salegentibacter sp. T436 TaxID=1729720 RepID=UPI00094A691D|nr:hypothetical protein [Salegentibacter sp. T436]APS40628.1 hypothetical protein AO058_17870 [Salegentibacter sp. T436]